MPDKNDILIYNTPNGNSNVEVYLFDEDIWMTQAALADLLKPRETTLQCISKTSIRKASLWRRQPVSLTY